MHFFIHSIFLSPPLSSSPHFPPSSDMQFVKTFLLSYQSFTTPLRLLGKLVERYNVVRPEGMPLQEFRALRITIQVCTCPCTQGAEPVHGAFWSVCRGSSLVLLRSRQPEVHHPPPNALILYQILAMYVQACVLILSIPSLILLMPNFLCMYVLIVVMVWCVKCAKY